MEQRQTRIRAIFDALKTNPNAFALNHGFSVPTLYGFAEGTKNPGYATLVNVCAAEPRISAEFLLRGEGEPLRHPSDVSTNTSTVEELRALRVEVNQVLDRRIQELGG